MRREQVNVKFRYKITLVLFAASVTFAAAPLFSRIALGASDHWFANAACMQEIGGSERDEIANRGGETKMVQKKLVAVPASVWGASGIHLNVLDGGVKIEYDCAEGEISEPLKMDEAGKFKADGVHIRLHGGPVRADDPPKRVPATFEGRISDKSMTLKVILQDSKEVIGEFSLTRDKTPRLHRCL